MAVPQFMHRKATALPALVLLATALALFASVRVVRAADDDEVAGAHQETYAEWVARMESHFARNPELMTTPGSGWKPFNRIKWFTDQRMVNGEDIPVMGRWNAFLRKRELENAAQSKVSGGSQWFSLGPTNLAGRMLDIDFDPVTPTTIYAGAASGGIWKSTDSGLNWFALDDELPTLAVGGVAVLASDPNIIVIGTGEATNNIDRVGGVGILRSTDAGATWSTTSFSLAVNSGHGFHAVEANPFTDVLLAAATDGVFRSTDQGVTWARARNDTANYTDVQWVPGSSTTAYCVRNSSGGSVGRVFKTVDGGVTWAGASAGLPSNTIWGKTRLGLTAANSNYAYIVFEHIGTNSYLGLYRTTDGGTSWTARNTSDPGMGGQLWYNLSLVVDPDNSERVIMGGTPAFRSANGGTNFFQIATPVHVDHHAAAYRPGSPNNLFVGTDGGIWESTDDGSSWIDRNTGLTTYQFYDICVSQPDPLRAWGGTQDNGTDRWVNSTIWLQGLGADGMVCNGHPTVAATVYGEIQSGDHRKSTNSGASWFAINGGLGGNGAWVTPTEIDPNNGNHLYTATLEPGIYRMTNGSSWTLVNSASAGSFSISPVNGQLVWVSSANSILYTTNDGASWNTAAPFGFTTLGATRVVAHPTDMNTVFVSFGSYGTVHVGRSTDLGATWEDLTGDFPNQPINAMVIDPQNVDHWFVGTDVGVWVSVNDGVNWLPFEVGFPNAVVADLEIQNSGRKLRAGTHGRGMWEVDIASLATGVPPGAVASARNLMFDPPSPNPLTNETVLRYAARSTAPVSLSIYDVQGRLVSVLAEHAADGIIRQLRWQTEDVPAGVYLALLRSGGEEKSQKLYVVK